MTKRKHPATTHDGDDDFSFDNLYDVDIESAAQEARDTAIAYGAKVIHELYGIASDPKCSTQARVAAGNGVLRAGGFFNHAGGEIGEKQPHEMSPAEIQAYIDRLERVAEERGLFAKASVKKSSIFD